MSQAAGPPVADVLGFRLVEPIGEGGMATVWRAEHGVLGRVVAVKLLDPQLARQPAVVARFVREARIEAGLDHPNILRVENVSGDPPAIVMEYVAGRSLEAMIGREVGPIPLDRALPLMRQILAAVAHAHANRVVHRDLKPANVLVDARGVVKVSDFGIAKVLGEATGTRTGVLLGTPHYMAPEQITSAREADARSDVYALGVTFYEMLAGRPPFDGDTDYAILKAHESAAPPDPRRFYPAIPEAVVAALLRALAKAPDARFPSAAAFAEALERAAAPAPPLAEPVRRAPSAAAEPIRRAPAAPARGRWEDPKPSPPPRPRRRRWPLVAGGALAVAGLAVAAVFVLRPSGPSAAALCPELAVPVPSEWAGPAELTPAVPAANAAPLQVAPSGAPDSFVPLYEAALAKYLSDDLAEAAELFEKAKTQGAVPEVDYYLARIANATAAAQERPEYWSYSDEGEESACGHWRALSPEVLPARAEEVRLERALCALPQLARPYAAALRAALRDEDVPSDRRETLWRVVVGLGERRWVEVADTLAVSGLVGDFQPLWEALAKYVYGGVPEVGRPEDCAAAALVRSVLAAGRTGDGPGADAALARIAALGRKPVPALGAEPSFAGIDWVVLPGGTFEMGSPPGVGQDDERPRHAVELRPFRLARTETTVGQYRRCVDVGACGATYGDEGCNWDSWPSDREQSPVNCVNWAQARAFCEWAGGRLPSEAEWEYAARSGGRERPYPWGDEPATPERAVMLDRDPGYLRRGNGTEPVCSRPDGNSAQGLCDLAGNVMEWVADRYDEGYYARSPTRDPQGPPPAGPSGEPRPGERVTRGGSWHWDADPRALARWSVEPATATAFIGFRCAR